MTVRLDSQNTCKTVRFNNLKIKFLQCDMDFLHCIIMATGSTRCCTVWRLSL